MRPVVFMLLWLSAAPTSVWATAETLMDVSFTAAPITRDDNGQSRTPLRGALPAGWEDLTGPARLEGHCQAVEEDGRGFLRLRLDWRIAGALRICRPLAAPASADDLWRVELTARSLTATPLELVIAAGDDHHHSVWETRQTLNPNWETRALLLAAPTDPEPSCLVLGLPCTGEVDVARVQVSRLSREDLAAELARRFPDGGPDNLLRESRLPLGLQSGWSLTGSESDGVAVDVRGLPGPSGAPVLRISAPEPIVLTGSPFEIPCPTVEHVAEVSLWGRGTWRLSVAGEGRWAEAAGTQFELAGEGEWERVELRFTPDLTAAFHCMRLEGTGAAWVDALRVGPADRPTPDPKERCEVALGCMPADDEPELAALRVQLEDHDPQIIAVVTGRHAGILRTRVSNAYGEEKQLRDVPVDPGPKGLTGSRLSFDLLEGRRLGPFRIEAWVEREGRRISPVSELVLVRVRRPRYWHRDAPQSAFGVHVGSREGDILLAKALGANWARPCGTAARSVLWAFLEPEPGQWRFGDDVIARYRDGHLMVMGELGTAPKWASYWQDSGRRAFTYFDWYFQVKRLEDYAAYVRTVVGRYKGRIGAYSVWNEPLVTAHFAVDYDEARGVGAAAYVASPSPQTDYVSLMRAAYEAAKPQDEEAAIVGLGSASVEGDGTRRIAGIDWTRGVLLAGGLQHCDAVDYHQYTDEATLFPGDAVERGYQMAAGPLAGEERDALERPVWMTAGHGALGMGRLGMYRSIVSGGPGENPLTCADQTCRFVISLLAQGVRRVFLDTLATEGGLASTSPKRCLVTGDGCPHPSAAAYSQMARQLEDTHFIRRLDLAEGVHAYLFAGDGRSVAVLAKRPGHAACAIPRPVGAAVEDLFGNPVDEGRRMGDELVYLCAEGGVEALAGQLDLR